MEKVRFGIIGLGNMGSFHLKEFPKVQNAVCTAICDVDKAKLEKFAAGTNLKRFENYQDMINSGEVDAILIAVPHYFHGEMARAAFAKNIHVLMEKPAAVSVSDARKTNEAYAKVPHLKFGIMFQQRTNARYQMLRQLVADGELGEISRITWIVTDWFRTWTYYASGGWRATWAGEGGGVLLNQCPHNLDLIQWITGLMPNRITAIATIGKTHPIEVEDEVSAILEYPNGAVGHFVTTTGEAPGTNRLEIAGDRGKIIAERRSLTFYRTRKSVQEFNRTSPDSFPSMETWEIDIPIPNKPEGHVVITQNFVNAILKDEALISQGVEGLNGLEIGNAMLMAGVTRQPVSIPVDGAKYDAFIQEMIKKYGGKKTLATKAAGGDMASSFQ